jgi:hypothetical protein
MRMGCTDRAIDQGSEAADRGAPDQRAAERADAGAQQFRFPAEALEAARGALARGLDALQALLALWPTETSSALTCPPPSTASSQFRKRRGSGRLQTLSQPGDAALARKSM